MRSYLYSVKMFGLEHSADTLRTHPITHPVHQETTFSIRIGVMSWQNVARFGRAHWHEIREADQGVHETEEAV